MYIFPAIDLYGGEAVRLYKGDYSQKTVYNTSPLAVAREFEVKGAEFVHIVDLEGAKDGTTPHLDIVASIARETSLKVEIGGGIRSMETVDKYISAGVSRVILGTAAVLDREFLIAALAKYGDKIAVGADIKDGRIAIKGWLETAPRTCEEFFADMQSLGVSTIICTDISKDGAMKGTNRELYKSLSEAFDVSIVASGGVSSLADVAALRDMGLYAAIIGKAYYIGAIDLNEAITLGRGEDA